MERKHNKKKSSDHEDKCRRCGRCCLLKYSIGDKYAIADPTRACKYLRYDDQNEQYFCSVYDKRFRTGECLPIEESNARGLTPADCSYMTKMRHNKKIKPLIVPKDEQDLYSKLFEFSMKAFGDAKSADDLIRERDIMPEDDYISFSKK
ncbi:MAG: hypothetical protein LBM09_01235 [Candidatus Nomurabacteria bacterium]|jgi:uncharacterized cysteine cluster protein YcgN (CxxCxxCC family)|nr:hypothetical protein [Candidatus Nomurabacteria bacterium]